MNKVLFSSNYDSWETPQWLYDELDKEFHFTLDPCSSDSNHKCERYFTKEYDGLLYDWRYETAFVNPPYGRDDTGIWVEKCYNEFMYHYATCVLLIPSRTDTIWFHKYINRIAEVRFIRGRLKFGNSNNSAPFPSMIVIYKL